jgi:hypothetical protein
VGCSGSTVLLLLNPEAFLPRPLRALAPRVRLELHYLGFAAGVVSFSLASSVLALPIHRLLNLLTAAIPLPPGVSVHRGAAAPELRVDVQALLNRQLSGVTLTELYLHEGDVVAVARVENVRRPPP